MTRRPKPPARPDRHRSPPLSVRLPPPTLEALRGAAEREGRAVGAVVLSAIELYLWGSGAGEVEDEDGPLTHASPIHPPNCP